MGPQMRIAVFSRAVRTAIAGLAALTLAVVWLASGSGFASAAPGAQIEAVAPVAVNDEYSVVHDTVLVVPLASGILSNDTNLPIPAYYKRIADANENLANSFSPDGSFSYTPTPGYIGDDSYTYCISTDQYGGDCLSNIATILIHVTGPPPAPIAVDDVFYIHSGETVQATGILGNDTHVPAGASYKLVVTGTHASGTTFNPDGSFSYTAAADYTGDDTYTYCVTAVYGAGQCLSNTGTILIHIQAPVPVPLLSDDAYTTPLGTTLTVAAPGFLGNDANVPDSPLITFSTSFAHSSDFDLNVDGSITYAPAAGFSGTDTATYCIVGDGDGCWSNTATITITVVAPVIVTTPAAVTPAPTIAAVSDILAATGSNEVSKSAIGVLLGLAGCMMLAVARPRRRH
jgi:hypothetical protein